MTYFLCKMILPRSDFVQTMTDSESNIMKAIFSQRRIRPIRAERRAGLIRAIARGRQWLNEIVAGTTSIDGLAQRQNCSLRQINMTLSMAFIAPAIVKAAIEGRLPRGIGIAQLRDVPPAWSEQFKQLGLPPL
jgi:site-specific DNA recombinase